MNEDHGKLYGLALFAEAWGAISSRLLQRQERWDFRKAPKGPHKRIVQIETAAMFATVAKRALADDRVFERSSLTHPYVEAELAPHGMSEDDLEPGDRDRIVKRVNKAITDDMETFVFFGLFEVTKHKHIYRLTDEGASCYAQLSN